MYQKITFSIFQERCSKKFNSKFRYFEETYIDYAHPLKIECPIHGIFYKRAQSHLESKYGCSRCGAEHRNDLRRSSLEDFLVKAKNRYGEKFIYDKVIYKGTNIPIIITCPIHGDFRVTPYDFLHHKYGCKKCYEEDKNHHLRTPTEEFIRKAENKFPGLYDYSETQYINMSTKVKIICKKHGPFYINPSNFLHSEQGCKQCKSSKHEKLIGGILKKRNILFLREYTFKECKDIHVLPFDFYLPDYNMCIEYQGKQHFEIYDFSHGKLSKEELEEALERTRKHDLIKKEFCSSNKINLLVLTENDELEKEIDKFILNISDSRN